MRRQDPKTKICNKCNIEKDIDKYPISSRRKDGTPCRRTECNKCYNNSKKAYYMPRTRKVKIHFDIFNNTDDEIKKQIASKMFEHKVPLSVLSRDFNIVYSQLKRQRDLYRDYYNNNLISV